jgi:hypothetical protein
MNNIPNKGMSSTVSTSCEVKDNLSDDLIVTYQTNESTHDSNNVDIYDDFSYPEIGLLHWDSSMSSSKSTNNIESTVVDKNMDTFEYKNIYCFAKKPIVSDIVESVTEVADTGVIDMCNIEKPYKRRKSIAKSSKKTIALSKVCDIGASISALAVTSEKETITETAPEECKLTAKPTKVQTKLNFDNSNSVELTDENKHRSSKRKPLAVMSSLGTADVDEVEEVKSNSHTDTSKNDESSNRTKNMVNSKSVQNANKKFSALSSSTIPFTLDRKPLTPTCENINMVQSSEYSQSAKNEASCTAIGGLMKTSKSRTPLSVIEPNRDEAIDKVIHFSELCDITESANEKSSRPKRYLFCTDCLVLI